MLDRCRQIIHATKALHLRAAMQVAFSCGLRSIDVRNLRPQNIDADSSSLNITNSKDGHQRRVPMAVSEFIRRWLHPAVDRGDSVTRTSPAMMSKHAVDPIRPKFQTTPTAVGLEVCADDGQNRNDQSLSPNED